MRTFRRSDTPTSNEGDEHATLAMFWEVVAGSLEDVLAGLGIGDPEVFLLCSGGCKSSSLDRAGSRYFQRTLETDCIAISSIPFKVNLGHTNSEEIESS